MEILLSGFEHQIDETILKRGLQYYKKGNVSQVEEVGAGEYEALVEGSEDYTVNLTVKNGIVKDYMCNCPYDMGPVCKHIAATLFYLQKDHMEDIDNIAVSKKKMSSKSSGSKKKTIPEQIDGILMALSEDDLKDFIRQNCKSDAVLEEVIPVLNSTDDSGGYIGGCIQEAMGLLEVLVDGNLDESLRKEVFNQLVTTFDTKKLDGWNWNFELVSFAIRLLKTPQEKEQVKAIISKIKPTGKSWDWDYRKAQELMQELLLKTESEEAVIQYLKENISNPDFREKLIRQAIAAKDYQYALELTHDGITKDGNEFIGLADKWREYQLDIYRKLGDNESTIRLAIPRYPG